MTHRDHIYSAFEAPGWDLHDSRLKAAECFNIIDVISFFSFKHLSKEKKWPGKISIVNVALGLSVCPP